MTTATLIDAPTEPGLDPDAGKLGMPGCSFNPTWGGGKHAPGWVSPWRFALNSAPVVVMIENYRSGLPWELMERTVGRAFSNL